MKLQLFDNNCYFLGLFFLGFRLNFVLFNMASSVWPYLITYLIFPVLGAILGGKIEGGKVVGYSWVYYQNTM